MGELSEQAQRGRLGLPAATALDDQRDDQCRLRADEPGRARDVPPVLLPEAGLAEHDLAVLR